MDCIGAKSARLVVLGCLLLLFTDAVIAATSVTPPLRAMRWLLPAQYASALKDEPSECLSIIPNTQEKMLVQMGRSAFSTPLLLGGQAARAGLSCNGCHRNGHGNPYFFISGLSNMPGTADVTSSLMSSHRGDGTFNPVRIPNLTLDTPKISRSNKMALENFIRGLIVEEFDGPVPSALTLKALATYIRYLSKDDCKPPLDSVPSVTRQLEKVHSATEAAQKALQLSDAKTAELMLSSARSSLGLIYERYADASLSTERALLKVADTELAAIKVAIENDTATVPIRLSAWLSKFDLLSTTLARSSDRSLYSYTLLKSHFENADP